MGRPRNGTPVTQSRTEALKTGIEYYRGQPCPSGHRPAIRYASTGCCVKCVDDVRAAESTKGLREHERVQEDRDLKEQVREVWDE